jgi:hypothetical protein
MPPDTPASLIASVSRALLGEVSDKLRCVQFRTNAQQIQLAFFFEGRPSDQDLDSVSAVAAEVAADFPDLTIAEEAVATDQADRIACRDGWHLVYARKEPSLVR